MRLFRKSRSEDASPGRPTRLHIGCGQQSIAGWINIDNQGLPGVDQVLDVRKGLPFADVASIYAEHFLEHLGLEDGLAFLAECRRVLRPDGILRLSTPNLDWVVLTHYRGPEAADDEAREDAFRLNRAFHGWGHQFLYNRAMLVSAVKAAGFARRGLLPLRRERRARAQRARAARNLGGHAGAAARPHRRGVGGGQTREDSRGSAPGVPRGHRVEITGPGFPAGRRT